MFKADFFLHHHGRRLHRFAGILATGAHKTAAAAAVAASSWLSSLPGSPITYR